MKCKATVQPIQDGVEVEVPMFFSGLSSIENGQLILIEFPDLNPVSKDVHVAAKVEHSWWEFWR